MSAKKSGFVNPMSLIETLNKEAGAEPVTLEPQATSGKPAQPPALPSHDAIEDSTMKEKMPWLDANPRVKVHFGLRMDEVLHHKFAYAASHTLGASMQTFALQALEEAVDKRLKDLGVL